MVTYTGPFTFTLVILGVITAVLEVVNLIVTIYRNIKK